MIPKLVYSDGYDLKLGAHVFPSAKYRMIQEKLLESQLAHAGDFLEPQPCSDDDIYLVHDRDYVGRLKDGKLTFEEILRLEIPYSREMVDAVWLATGGSILAAREAASCGGAVNIGGGFHHAFPDHGEGFCAIHDVAVAIRRMQKDGVIERAVVVDCDVHHGNGTAAIFAGDDRVFTLSLHQENNYPHPKPPSSLDVNLPDGIGDEEYLKLLEAALAQALYANKVGMLFYVAGADPYYDDQLGGLSLTLQGLRKRDSMVVSAARSRNIPVMITLAGGYAHSVSDTVEIHVNTVRALQEALT